MLLDTKENSELPLKHAQYNKNFIGTFCWLKLYKSSGVYLERQQLTTGKEMSIKARKALNIPCPSAEGTLQL